MGKLENDDLPLEDLAYAGTLHAAPYASISILIEHNQIILDASADQPVGEPHQPVEKFVWSSRETNPSQLTIQSPSALAGQALTGEVSTQQLTLACPAADGEYYISLRIAAQNGSEDISTTYFVVENQAARLKEFSYENAEWVDQAVVYGLVPRNFSRPGFQGITSQLDDLQDLGITAIWLSPVNSTPLGNYGYQVVNYFELAEGVGTKEDLRTLVQQAHRRGIRVLMDFVPNHASEHHRYFEDTLRRGKESPYWDFFDRDETGAHTNYFYWGYLPNLNFHNPLVVRWITEAFAYWVREFDVDGFRVDVAWGIRQRNPEYWPYWRKALMRIKPDLLLLAEASARDGYYFSDGYDAAYDWTDELGHGAWEHVFEDRSLLTERLTSALTNQGRGFHPDAKIFRFLNNNDTGARFITRYGLGMTRLATALLLTLPGLPGMFLGDETGTEFLPYKTREPLDRKPDPHGLRETHKQLIHLRRQMPALYSRHMQLLECTPRQKVFAYLRWDEKSAQTLLALFNFFDTPQAAQVNIPEKFGSVFQNHPLADLLNGKTYPAMKESTLTITLPPMSALLLSPG